MHGGRATGKGVCWRLTTRTICAVGKLKAGPAHKKERRVGACCGQLHARESTDSGLAQRPHNCEGGRMRVGGDGKMAKENGSH
jgi:hypothetical protein